VQSSGWLSEGGLRRRHQELGGAGIAHANVAGKYRETAEAPMHSQLLQWGFAASYLGKARLATAHSLKWWVRHRRQRLRVSGLVVVETPA
jgi:hypothetical protein